MFAREIFESIIKGKNFMTPHVIDWREEGDYIAEISQGEDFNRQPMYGVTVVNRSTMERESGLSKCCSSREEVEEHWKDIVNGTA